MELEKISLLGIISGRAGFFILHVRLAEPGAPFDFHLGENWMEPIT